MFETSEHTERTFDSNCIELSLQWQIKNHTRFSFKIEHNILCSWWERGPLGEVRGWKLTSRMKCINTICVSLRVLIFILYYWARNCYLLWGRDTTTEWDTSTLYSSKFSNEPPTSRFFLTLTYKPWLFLIYSSISRKIPLGYARKVFRHRD